MVSLAFICAFVFQRKTHSALTQVTRKVMLGVGRWIDVWVLDSKTARYFLLCVFFAVVSLPMIALFWLSEDLLYGFFYFALAFLLLLFVTGECLSESVLEAFSRRWKTGEMRDIFLALKCAGMTSGTEIHSEAVLMRELARWLVLQNARGYLFPLFWCFAGGPIAALIVKCLEWLASEQQAVTVREVSMPLLRWAEWLPARLFGTLLLILASENRGNYISLWFKNVVWSKMDASKVLLISVQLALPGCLIGKPDPLVKKFWSGSYEPAAIDYRQNAEGGLVGLRRLLTRLFWLVWVGWALTDLIIQIPPLFEH